MVIGLAPVADGDLFWHLAAGREMVRTGSLLANDPFSASALGRPWPDVHWLFQLAVYGIHQTAGLAGLVVAKAMVVAAGALLLRHAVGRTLGARAEALFSVVMLVALFWARHFLVVRPVVLTLLFLSLFFVILERHRRAGETRLLFALPALQVLWANCQGLSALGPAVILAYLTGAVAAARAPGWYPFSDEGKARPAPLGLALALTVAASFATPFGLEAAALPLRLLGRITPTDANVFAAQVAENLPPFVLERSFPEQIWHFKWFLGALGGAFVLARGRVPLSRVLLTGGLVALALMANRNVLLLYWLGTPVMVLLAAPALLASRVPLLSPLALAGTAALAIVAFVREPSIAAPTPFRFPVESARQLAASGARGVVFAPDHHGGYLIWTLHPRVSPWMDTRLILRTAGEYADYLAAVDDPSRFDALAARQGFSHVVLATAYPDRYLGLIRHLAAHPGWRLASTDGTEVLFERADARPALDLGARATTERIVEGLDQRYGHDDRLRAAARLHLAKLQLLLGHPDEARHVLAPLRDPAAQALIARAQGAGNLAAAPHRHLQGPDPARTTGDEP